MMVRQTIAKNNCSEDPNSLFYKKNAGASSARNYGIEKHNYISFVDADDYWYPILEMFEKQIVFRHQSIFSSNRNRNFKTHFNTLAKNGRF
jgi:glycosyltransferase involved in cell wall biosynthesis